MKIRQAKKIMEWNLNSRPNLHQIKRFRQLRPAYTDEHGQWVYPSWHDIDIIRRARTRLYQWVRRYNRRLSKDGVT